MNPVFVDTSAVFALFNPDDTDHERARAVFADLTARRAPLVTPEGARDSSLVDAVSFLILREPRFEEVFCFDRHFANRGPRLLPA